MPAMSPGASFLSSACGAAVPPCAATKPKPAISGANWRNVSGWKPEKTSGVAIGSSDEPEGSALRAAGSRGSASCDCGCACDCDGNCDACTCVDEEFGEGAAASLCVCPDASFAADAAGLLLGPAGRRISSIGVTP